MCQYLVQHFHVVDKQPPTPPRDDASVGLFPKCWFSLVVQAADVVFTLSLRGTSLLTLASWGSRACGTLNYNQKISKFQGC